VTVLELIVLTQLVVKHGPKRLFEIGTFDGRTTLNLAANAADDARVFTLDLPQEQMTATALNVDAEEKTYINKATSGSRFIGKEYGLKITQLYGDSATFDFSPFENSMDFVFVDGSHTYEYVMNDSCVALRLLSNGRGVILWHDFNAWPGVTLALNALHRDWREFRELKHVEGTTLAYLHLG
jgi:predicted O-methyltransferase YrrM